MNEVHRVTPVLFVRASPCLSSCLKGRCHNAPPGYQLLGARLTAPTPQRCPSRTLRAQGGGVSVLFLVMMVSRKAVCRYQELFFYPPPPEHKHKPSQRTPPTKDLGGKARAVLGAPHTAATKSMTLRLLHAPIETCHRQPALIDYLEAPNHFPPAATPTPTLLLEHCTPLMRALDQCRCSVCPTLKQRHLLTHWGARPSTCIRWCHKIYENASNATLQLYTRATHTIRTHTYTQIHHTSIGDMPASSTA